MSVQVKRVAVVSGAATGLGQVMSGLGGVVFRAVLRLPEGAGLGGLRRPALTRVLLRRSGLGHVARSGLVAISMGLRFGHGRTP